MGAKLIVDCLVLGSIHALCILDYITARKKLTTSNSFMIIYKHLGMTSWNNQPVSN